MLGLGIEPVERLLEHREAAVAGLPLAHEHGEVVDLGGIRHRDQRLPRFRVDQVGLVVVQQVGEVEHPLLGQQIGRVGGGAQRGRQPPPGPLAGGLLADAQGLADHLALTLGVLVEIGQQVGLHVVVGHDLPAALDGGVDDGLPLDPHLGVHRARRGHALGVEHVEHPPDADALAILAPGPVGVVVDVARELAAHDAGAAGVERLGVLARGVPVFEVGGQDHRETLAVGPFQGLAVGDGDEIVVHGTGLLPQRQAPAP